MISQLSSSKTVFWNWLKIEFGGLLQRISIQCLSFIENSIVKKEKTNAIFNKELTSSSMKWKIFKENVWMILLKTITTSRLQSKKIYRSFIKIHGARISMISLNWKLSAALNIQMEQSFLLIFGSSKDFVGSSTHKYVFCLMLEQNLLNWEF
jgi:hypothetical protein